MISSSPSKAMRPTFSLISRGSWTRLRACFQRHQAQPATVMPQQGAGGQQRSLEDLPLLHPQVASECNESDHAQDGHGHPVQLQGLGLVGVGGVGALVAGVLEGPLLVGLGPVGTQGAQQQPGQNALPLPQVGKGADDRQQRVGTGVQQVVVPEGAQGHVLRPAGTRRVRPQACSPRWTKMGSSSTGTWRMRAWG